MGGYQGLTINEKEKVILAFEFFMAGVFLSVVGILIG